MIPQLIANPVSLETGSSKENFRHENKYKKNKDKNHCKKKQEEKNLLKQKNNNP